MNKQMTKHEDSRENAKPDAAQTAAAPQFAEQAQGVPLNQARILGLGAQKKPALTKPGLVAIVAILIALATDLLLYNYRLGLQWAFLVNMLLLGAVALALLLKKKLPWQSLLLSLLTGGLAILSVTRSEDRTSAGLILLSFSGLVILAISYLNGQWMVYRLREHLLERIKLVFYGITAVAAAIINLLRGNALSTEAKGQKRSLVKALVIGLFIALPFVLLLGMLLAGADEAFSSLLGNMLTWLHFDNLQDIFNQAFFVAVLSWIIFGMYAHAFTETSVKVKIEPDTALFKPFLGSTEALVVLGSLNLLFALFLFVQVRYFFAGQEAVTSLGLTYSSYAVKGFNELIMVACLVLLIHYGLTAVTRLVTAREKRWYAALASLMVLQVGVVLVSAHMRLALYEQIYGFTQLRLVSHLFIPFVGLVLLASVLMQLRRAYKHMAIVLFLTAVAFGLCLALVNVDATVARKNLQRADAGEKLDYGYLIHDLSEDALPALVEHWQAPGTSHALRQDLAAVLACRADLFERRVGSAQPYWGYDLAEWHARNTYAALGAQLPALTVERDNPEDWPMNTIMIQGERYYCASLPSH